MIFTLKIFIQQEDDGICHAYPINKIDEVIKFGADVVSMEYLVLPLECHLEDATVGEYIYTGEINNAAYHKAFLDRKEMLNALCGSTSATEVFASIFAGTGNAPKVCNISRSMVSPQLRQEILDVYNREVAAANAEEEKTNDGE